MEPVYQSNICRKDLHWLHFDDEPRVQQRQQVKDQQSCKSFFVAYPTIFHAWAYDSFIEMQSNLRSKKLHRTDQGSSFLGDSFSNRDNVRAPIQLRNESQPHHLKRWFFLKNRPIHFHINSTIVIRPVK